MLLSSMTDLIDDGSLRLQMELKIPIAHLTYNVTGVFMVMLA